MNKILSFSKRFHPVLLTERVIADKCEDVKDPNLPLLNAIYAVDSSTGLPKGDLAIFMNDKANPEIRSYIQSYLLKENPNLDKSQVSNDIYNKFRTKLTDDDFAFFSRNHGESNEEYRDRIKLFLLNEKRNAEERKYKKQLDKILGHDSKRDS